jgi:hypothetical protein
LQLKIALAASTASSLPKGETAGVSTLPAGSGTTKADARVAPKATARVMNLIFMERGGFVVREVGLVTIRMMTSQGR